MSKLKKLLNETSNYKKKQSIMRDKKIKTNKQTIDYATIKSVRFGNQANLKSQTNLYHPRQHDE